MRVLLVVGLCLAVVGCSSVSAPADPIPPCRFQVASFGVVVAPALVHDGVLRCRVTP